MSAPHVVATHHLGFVSGESTHTGSPGPDERFPIASITKTLTALLAARLAVDGVLSWDAPLGPATDITLGALLGHTARVPFELSPGDWDATAPTAADVDASLDDPPRLALPPGTWHYSNFGYALAARLLERATGRAYPELLAERVLGPLGMAHTSFPSATEPPPLLGAAGPAGDLWSTPSDLLVLARALNGDHPEVVDDRVLAMLLRSSVSAPDGDDLGPGIRSRRVGLHRLLATSGTIRDRTTCLLIWPRRGASVLIAEPGIPHDVLVDAGVHHWQRVDGLARTWWWDGQEVVELRFGGEVELRLRETSWPFALFTGSEVAGSLRGIDAHGSPITFADRGDALESDRMLLTADPSGSAFRVPATP